MSCLLTALTPTKSKIIQIICFYGKGGWWTFYIFSKCQIHQVLIITEQSPPVMKVERLHNDKTMILATMYSMMLMQHQCCYLVLPVPYCMRYAHTMFYLVLQYNVQYNCTWSRATYRYGRCSTSYHKVCRTVRCFSCIAWGQWSGSGTPVLWSRTNVLLFYDTL